MTSNLPPGVTESMIPGNRPEDEAWETFHDEIDKDCVEEGFSDQDAWLAWKFGVGIIRSMRKCGVKFPHEVEESPIAEE